MSLLTALAMFLQTDVVASEVHGLFWVQLFLGVMAVCMVLTLLGIGIAGLMALKYVKKIDGVVDLVQLKVMPMVDQAQALVNDLTPKVKNMVESAEEMTFTIRAKVDELSSTIDHINRTVLDVNARTHAKVERVDGMVGDALNTLHDVSHAVQNGIKVPVRQVAGVIAGIRAGVETLAGRLQFKSKAPGSPYDY